MQIPFNKPYITGGEIPYMQDALDRGRFSGDGYYTQKVSALIQERFGADKALFVTSCSSALDMSAMLLDLKEGDEVIMPSFNFVSTANSAVSRGARVVFAEIKPDTLNMDPKDVERKITPRTRALFPVHYAGVSCEMDIIMGLAARHNLKVVEDAAQGVNAKYKGKYLGTIGDMGCYSFHETKNYVCGEGGALLVNRDKELALRAEVIREKGTNRSQFFRGEVDKYTWIDIGSSYLASDLLAAFLYAQFEQLDIIQEKRKCAYLYYREHLEPLEQQGLLRLPHVPGDCHTNYHMFYILLESQGLRDSVMNFLKREGILAVFHYIPLHTSPMGRKMGYEAGDLPVTEELSCRLLRLPMYAGIKEEELSYIVNKLKIFLQRNKE